MQKKPDVYGKVFVLKTPLLKVECWNSSNGAWADFAAGERIEVNHAYDAYHTNISWEGCIGRDGFHAEGRPLTNMDGTPGHLGYRFIVNNVALGKAIGVEMPAKTADIVGDIMAYEAGETTPAQRKKLFRTLKRTGIGAGLQGHYSSRM
jgi:hypothetical protein